MGTDALFVGTRERNSALETQISVEQKPSQNPSFLLPTFIFGALRQRTFAMNSSENGKNLLKSRSPTRYHPYHRNAPGDSDQEQQNSLPIDGEHVLKRFTCR
jgi:hypothetical protein